MTKAVAPPPRARTRWTDDDDTYLRDHWGLLPDARIARKLGRTVPALLMRATHLHLGGRSANYYSAHQAAHELGVSDGTLKTWIVRGWLAADRPIFLPGRARPRAWRIVPAALEAFVRTHPERLDLKRMPPGYLRALLQRIVPPTHVSRTWRPWSAAEDAYLINQRGHKTQPQLAAFLNRSKEAVHYRLGLLRAAGRLVPYKGHWCTRLANGTATAPVRWTPAEDAYIQGNWGRLRTPEEGDGWGVRLTSADIAAHLGRTRLAVESRASRLGCKNPGWHPDGAETCAA